MRRSDRLTGARLVRCLLWPCLALALCGAGVSAAARALSFEHFIHTMLEAKDGLPAQANSIVQTPDGYMWFGTPDGLFRYNGQSFERVPVSRKGAFTEASIIEAIVTRRGEMWLAAGHNAGVVVLRDGVLHQTNMASPPPQITHLVERADGTLWAASSGSSKRLYRYADQRWQQMDVSLAMPTGAVADLEADRHGTIWVSLHGPEGGKLAYLRAGSTRFETADARIGLGRLTLDRNGGLWVSDNFGTRLIRDADGPPPVRPIAYPPVPNVGFPRIRFDKKGNIWGSSLSGGMFLIPDAANADNSGTPPETFGKDKRLGTVATLDVFADREGNIWISSSESLHRFHPANAVRVSAIESHPSSPQRLAAASDGSIYLFSLGRLYRIQPDDQPRLIASDLGNNAVICAARSGGVWYLDDSRTLLFDGTGRRALPGPQGGRDMPILCEEDGFGRLWSISKDMIGWFRGERWHAGFPGLGQVDVWDAATDPSGALILSVGANKLLRIDEQSVAPVETGWTDSIASMRTTRSGLLVSHTAGLWRAGVDGQRAASVIGRSLAKARDFDVDESYFWVYGLSGVKRIPLTEFGKAAGSMDAPAATMVFDWSEGLPVGKQDIGFRGRQIAMGRDGRLWVLTRAGPYVIDNKNIIRNRIPPPLVIRALWADGHRLSNVRDGQKLRGGTRSVRIAYSALSYSMPEGVRFKYRLIGASSDWTYADNRHEVTFDNLGPGNYRFEVAGANEDGIWNDQPAAMDFAIAPTFLQSPQVKLGAALLLLAACIMAYRWRTYVLTSRIRNAMSERAAERERIARELHDTLLQSVQGLILRFQSLVDHLPEHHPARIELFTTLDQADEILAESRKRVLDLRAHKPRSDLKSVITALAERQLPASRFQTEIRTSGTVRVIEPTVFNVLIDVANECLFNILRHAQASRVYVEIRYNPLHLEMDITDNGVGLDTGAISTAAATGHFGVVGMHERVANIGGKLRLESKPGEGVTVAVQIPSSIAYRAKNAQSAEKSGRKNRGGFWLWGARQARKPLGQ